MAPSSKVVKAFEAMKEYGVPAATVKPVLKNLLNLYDKNWKLIEDENYRVLADAIFDLQKPEGMEVERQDSESDDGLEECQPAVKRSRLKHSQGDPSPSSDGSPMVKKQALVSQTCYQQKVGGLADQTQTEPESGFLHKDKPVIVKSTNQLGDDKSECKTGFPVDYCEGKRKFVQDGSEPGQTKACKLFSVDREAELDSLSPQTNMEDTTDASASAHSVHVGKRVYYEEGTPVFLKEPKVECNSDLSPETNVFSMHQPHCAAPPSVKTPGNGISEFIEVIDLDSDDNMELDSGNSMDLDIPVKVYDAGSSNENGFTLEGNSLELLDYKHTDSETFLKLLEWKQLNPGIDETNASDSSQIDIASSSNGEVKISFICNSHRSDFSAANLDSVMRQLEEKYLNLYSFPEPGFSLSKLMKDICESFLVNGTIPSNLELAGPANIPPKFVSLKKSDKKDVPDDSLSKFSNRLVKYQNLLEVRPHTFSYLALNNLDFLQNIRGLNIRKDGYSGSFKKMKALEGLPSSNSSRMVIVPRKHSSPDMNKSHYYVEDITCGEENAKISLVNEVNDERQPSFRYIAKNSTYQNAYVKFILARISDDNCCSNCFGDCLTREIPCACAGETGGEFAYTGRGLIKENFLAKCISIRQDPKRHNYIYCDDCPLERSKDKRFSGACKGHLVGQFIKECWYRCGCNLKCGNRVVQRGITAKLQVFMTREGKGWGLRTLEDIPKGAFVCEYVGEIVTNTELFERNMKCSNDKHTYPVLLDADWSAENVLKDEEALCLDATYYGNVARFINHRCFDANLIDIPVEVETPDHHYYHVAFFTTRKVDAFEELTWDYSLDFADDNHPVKAFRCHCGSKFCRDMKHGKRTRGT